MTRERTLFIEWMMFVKVEFSLLYWRLFNVYCFVAPFGWLTRITPRLRSIESIRFDFIPSCEHRYLIDVEKNKIDSELMINLFFKNFEKLLIRTTIELKEFPLNYTRNHWSGKILYFKNNNFTNISFIFE